MSGAIASRPGLGQVMIDARLHKLNGECISITGTDDRFLYVNDAFLRTYGYREHELIGQHVDILRSARTPTEVADEILPATMAGNWCGELWNRTKEGREFPISLATFAVYNEDGRRIALVGIARDITERKQAEERINRYLSDLEGARDAQEKNAADLARKVEQLAVERDRAEAATRAKSEFLSSMSHEIRTPLCGILGMTGLLLDTPLTLEQRGYVEAVRSSGEAPMMLLYSGESSRNYVFR